MLFSLLFMQLAVASYACPGLAIAQTESMAEMPSDMGQPSMSGCIGKDAVQPNLCHAHDQVGKQSLDKPGTLVVQPFVSSSLVITLIALNDLDYPADHHPQSPLLTRSTAPPLSIRNCCFRI